MERGMKWPDEIADEDFDTFCKEWQLAGGKIVHRGDCMAPLVVREDPDRYPSYVCGYFIEEIHVYYHEFGKWTDYGTVSCFVCPLETACREAEERDFGWMKHEVP